MRTTSGAIVAVFLFAASIAGCGGEKEERTAEPESSGDDDILVLSQEASRNAAIGTAKAGEARIVESLVIQGEVRPIPERLASIVARLEGVVTDIYKKEGDRVEKGEEIVTIESKKLAETKLAYIEAEHKYEFAKEALEREKKLMDKQITSKEVYRKVEHDVQEARVAHEAALQRLRLLGFTEKWLHRLVKRPDQKMTRYTLKAPFGGEVIEKSVTMGEAVEEDLTLFRLADLSELHVEIMVPMRSIPSFELGKRVTVRCEVLGLETEGEVTFVSSTAMSETRTIPVKVTIVNPKGEWRPGQPATVRLKDSSHMAAVTVPAAAVHQVDGREVVFAREGDRGFRMVEVELGERDGERIEILGGLDGDETVATKNSLVLKSEYLKRQGE